MSSPPLANSFWIEPGRLLAGEYPGTGDRTSSEQRLAALIDAGVSYFIDLTQPGELPPYDHWLPSARADDGRYIVYVRKAIQDHGVPQDPESMAEVLDYIDRAIEAGHQVYVHCRAGIGRTNTVVGCWLRRRGLAGPQAILRLNQLWRANARSRSWPTIPETREQTQYVEDWREPDAAAAVGLDLNAARALRWRYLGSMIGLACGDAMGATLQFRKPGQFTPIADLLSGGHWQLPRGAWTDDTAMALCLAESLLEHEQGDGDDQRARYRRWQRQGYRSSTGSCIGITASVAAALHDGDAGASTPGASGTPAAGGTQVGGGTPAAGGTQVGSGAGIRGGGAGTGGAQALTRAGIVALFAAATPERAVRLCLAAVCLTDTSPRLGLAARFYLCLMIAALRGAARDTLCTDARNLWASQFAVLGTASGAPAGTAEFDDWVSGAEHAAAHASGAEHAAAHAEPAVSSEIAVAPAWTTDDPVEVLQLVLGTLLAASGFREGLLAVVNRGGDADVNGALYGQLAGALYGSPGIPHAWSGALLRRELLTDVADRLLVAALAPRT
jgi:ADP-ribosylglycohydrolase/protein-tyrosine phosphatase